MTDSIRRTYEVTRLGLELDMLAHTVDQSRTLNADYRPVPGATDASPTRGFLDREAAFKKLAKAIEDYSIGLSDDALSALVNEVADLRAGTDATVSRALGVPRLWMPGPTELQRASKQAEWAGPVGQRWRTHFRLQLDPSTFRAPRLQQPRGPTGAPTSPPNAPGKWDFDPRGRTRRGSAGPRGSLGDGTGPNGNIFGSAGPQLLPGVSGWKGGGRGHTSGGAFGGRSGTGSGGSSDEGDFGTDRQPGGHPTQDRDPKPSNTGGDGQGGAAPAVSADGGTVPATPPSPEPDSSQQDQQQQQQDDEKQDQTSQDKQPSSSPSSAGAGTGSGSGPKDKNPDHEQPPSGSEAAPPKQPDSGVGNSSPNPEGDGDESPRFDPRSLSRPGLGPGGFSVPKRGLRDVVPTVASGLLPSRDHQPDPSSDRGGTNPHYSTWEKPNPDDDALQPVLLGPGRNPRDPRSYTYFPNPDDPTGGIGPHSTSARVSFVASQLARFRR